MLLNHKFQIFLILTTFALNTQLKAQTKSPCDMRSGSVVIAQGNAAATSYKNLKKQIGLAEKAKAAGELLKMENNLKNANRYLGFVIKKEPNADLSTECAKLKSLLGDSESLSKNKADFAKANYNFTFFIDNYKNFAGGTFENERYKEQNKVFDEVLNFDRNAMMGQMQQALSEGKLDSQGKQLQVLNKHIPHFITF